MISMCIFDITQYLAYVKGVKSIVAISCGHYYYRKCCVFSLPVFDSEA